MPGLKPDSEGTAQPFSFLFVALHSQRRLQVDHLFTFNKKIEFSSSSSSSSPALPAADFPLLIGHFLMVDFKRDVARDEEGEEGLDSWTCQSSFA